MMSYLIGEISDITLLAPPFNLQETEAEYRGWIDRGARVTRWPGINRYTGVLEFAFEWSFCVITALLHCPQSAKYNNTPVV